jgi:hypothetical protein
MAAQDQAALIVALSAQLSQFERDMKKAVELADKSTRDIEDKFEKINPSVARGSFFGSFLGGMLSELPAKAIRAIEDEINQLIKRFEQLQLVSTLTGLSMEEIWGIQEAAQKNAGVAINDSTASLKVMEAQLASIHRGEKNVPLATLFAANVPVLGQVNAKLLDIYGTMDAIGKLFANADAEQRQELARRLGITESMVAYFVKMGEESGKVAKNLAKASPEFTYMAEQAKVLKGLFEEVGGAITKWLGQQVLQAVVEGLDAVLSILKRLAGFQFAPWTKPIGDFKDIIAKLEDMKSRYGIAAGTAYGPPAPPGYGQPKPPPPPAPGGPRTVVPPAGAEEAERRTAFDREIERITRHTEQINADTQSMFANTAVHAQLRAEFQLLNAARLTNKNITSDQIAEYERLRSQGIEPLLALTRAHIDLTKEQADKLVDASTKAKTATESFAAAAQKLQDINQLSSTFGSALSSAFTDAIIEGKKLNEVFASLIKTLEKAAINQVFASFFQPRGGAATSLFGSLFTSTSAGGAAAATSTSSLNVTGSLYQTGTDFARGGMAMVGEAGPELVRLPTGAQVIPNDVLKTMGSNAGSIIYSPAIDARGASVEAVARLAQVLEQDRKTFTARTVDVIQRARRSRIPGI